MTTTTSRHGLTVIQKAYKVCTDTRKPTTPSSPKHSLPSLSDQRKLASLSDEPFDLTHQTPTTLQQYISPSKQPPTILYLAYGSNLSAETFLNHRNIHPLTATNVVVPSLTMTFDLAGLPYLEPCFANTKYRIPSPSLPHPTSASFNERSPLLKPPDYHRTHWTKGLVGVVYEVTPTDYAHIIATEGGGASYQDILISCHALSPDDPTVPLHPSSPPFKAHTLYSPAISPPSDEISPADHFSRPDPNYAQPSPRYLSLITTGAAEHRLPAEYISYLHSLHPYTITTTRQRIGAWLFTMTWLQLIRLIFGLNKRFAGEDGRAPSWLVWLAGMVFGGMWRSYDAFFVGVFGDGERTIGGKGDEEGDDRWRGKNRDYGMLYMTDEEKR